MDKQGLKLVRLLEADGRQSFARLGHAVGLSKTRCWQRVKELERCGVIRGYRAVLDSNKLGLGVRAFIQATIQAAHYKAFEAAAERNGSILECFTTAGQGDYLLHILVADVAALDDLLREEISLMPGVQRVVTTVCMRTAKERAPLSGCLP